MARGRAFYRRGDLGGAFGAFGASPSLLCFGKEIVGASDSNLAIEGA
jgi:hypothetical protein